ncbi:MAG: tRNA (adenosine(37)-N6)-threonylcarbamoyltransferase complex dimerization subunit type 1 TsaB [Porticoccaceae bacterium]
MPALLALDTSTQLCSVALYRNGEIAEEVIDVPRGHTQHILPAIDRLLSSTGIALNTLDAIALTAGPGSFTGLRIGMGVAQGLAFGVDLPVIPVSTLQVLAQGAIRTEQVGEELLIESLIEPLIVPMLDARMSDVYWGLYCNEIRVHEDGSSRAIAREVIPDQVNRPAAVWDQLQQLLNQDHRPELEQMRRGIGLGAGAGVGDGWAFAEEIGFRPSFVNLEARSVARDIIPLALEKLLAGELLKPEALEPYYIRDKIHWQKRKRLR